MKPATRDWIRGAKEDFEVAATLVRRRGTTPTNTIGFHLLSPRNHVLWTWLETEALPNKSMVL